MEEFIERMGLGPVCKPGVTKENKSLVSTPHPGSRNRSGGPRSSGIFPADFPSPRVVSYDFSSELFSIWIWARLVRSEITEKCGL